MMAQVGPLCLFSHSLAAGRGVQCSCPEAQNSLALVPEVTLPHQGHEEGTVGALKQWVFHLAPDKQGWVSQKAHDGTVSGIRRPRCYLSPARPGWDTWGVNALLAGTQVPEPSSKFLRNQQN
jgi:hypothetical protein